MKKYIFLAASALTLASCTSEDFLGNTPGNVQSNTSAINFDGGTGKISRATGADAAGALNNNYVVFGYKTDKNDSKTTVFDHYTIHWNNLAGKTESNTKGWEYVGLTANSLTSLTGDKAQTIKYWDYSASQYDFVAFSFGKAIQGEGDGKVKATAVTTTPKLSYTLTGAVNDLAKCFIADRITAKPDMETTKKKANLLVGYKDDVQFNFRSLSTKVTMGIYETIPGYSVKDVKFYSSDNTPATDNKPTLYAKDKNIPAGNGTVTVTFPTTTESETDYNKAHVEFAAATESDKSSSIQFGNLSTVEKEKEEKGTTGFIGRDITEFSTPKEGTNKKYEVVIPAKVGALTLKVDYTLESIDGSGETIKVTGATAVVPEKYTNWEPNYAYTYIFKISDKTNGSTGGSTAGLYPITFDAIVTETETGKQETITTVADNSITTYAKDAINEEYKKDANIYVSVNNTTDLHINSGNEEDVPPTNVKLFTATGTGSYEKNITEATVALCLSKGTTTATTGEKVLSVDDDNKLTVTPATGLTIVTQIEAADAVDGNAISGNFAKFKPTNAGTYVFEFTDTKNKNTKYYKVIIVK